MLIHEVAKASGLTKDTIRYYTRLGIISAKEKQAGSRTYADYDESVLHALEEVRFAKSAGFKLSEIAVEGDARAKITDEEAIRLLTEKLEEINQKKNDLLEIERILRAKITKLSK